MSKVSEKGYCHGYVRRGGHARAFHNMSKICVELWMTVQFVLQPQGHRTLSEDRVELVQRGCWGVIATCVFDRGPTIGHP